MIITLFSKFFSCSLIIYFPEFFAGVEHSFKFFLRTSTNNPEITENALIARARRNWSTCHQPQTRPIRVPANARESLSRKVEEFVAQRIILINVFNLSLRFKKPTFANFMRVRWCRNFFVGTIINLKD